MHIPAKLLWHQIQEVVNDPARFHTQKSFKGVSKQNISSLFNLDRENLNCVDFVSHVCTANQIVFYQNRGNESVLPGVDRFVDRCGRCMKFTHVL